jgi:hypothetical protein
MQVRDDRTPEQKKTHTVIILGTDSFMSGWGLAEGGVSYAGWACEPKHQWKVLDWVSNRSEMKRVRVVTDPYRPKGKGDCHIYVVDDNHPALTYLKSIGYPIDL